MVDLLLLLSAIQNGPPGAHATPQAFCRFGSVWAAATTALEFDTKAVSVSPVVATGWTIGLPPPLPPPHAATEMTLTTPITPRVMAQCNFMASSLTSNDILDA